MTSTFRRGSLQLLIPSLALSLAFAAGCASKEARDGSTTEERPSAEGTVEDDWAAEFRLELDKIEGMVLADRDVETYFRERAEGTDRAGAAVRSLGKRARAMPSASASVYRVWREARSPDPGTTPDPPTNAQLHAAHEALQPYADALEALDEHESFSLPFGGLSSEKTAAVLDDVEVWQETFRVARDRAHLGARLGIEGWEADLVLAVGLAEKQAHPNNLLQALVQASIRASAWSLAAELDRNPTIAISAVTRDELLSLRRAHEGDVYEGFEGELLHGVALAREILGQDGGVPKHERADVDKFGRNERVIDYLMWLKDHPGELTLPAEFSEVPWAVSMHAYLAEAAEHDESIRRAVAELQGTAGAVPS